MTDEDAAAEAEEVAALDALLEAASTRAPPFRDDPVEDDDAAEDEVVDDEAAGQVKLNRGAPVIGPAGTSPKLGEGVVG